MDLLSILLKACHRVNISSQNVGNDTGLTWGASGKCATPCHVQCDRAPLQIIFLSQLSTFLIALVSLCALEQAVCRSTGISERVSEDRFTHFSIASGSTGGPCPSPTMTFTALLGTSPAITHSQPGPGGYTPPLGGPVMVSVCPSSPNSATRYTRRELECTACVTNPKSINETASHVSRGVNRRRQKTSRTRL